MDTPQSTPSTRPGTPGLDVFKIAAQSVSGFLSNFKTGDPHQVRMLYTSIQELVNSANVGSSHGMRNEL